MEAIKIDALLTEKTSKSGNLYKVVELQLTPTYKKLVFLDSAELELLALNNKANDNNPFKK